MWFLLPEGPAASSYQNCCKVKLSESVWTLMTRTNKTGLRVCQVLRNTYYRSRQQPRAAVWIGTSFLTSSRKETRKTKWCCMQTWRDFTFRSALEEHEGQPSLETNTFHFLCHLVVNSPLTTRVLQTCPSYGQSTTSLPGSLIDFPCLRSAGVAWSSAGLAILRSSDGLIFNMLVWDFTLNSNFWEYLNLPTLQNPVVLGHIK